MIAESLDMSQVASQRAMRLRLNLKSIRLENQAGKSGAEPVVECPQNPPAWPIKFDSET